MMLDFWHLVLICSGILFAVLASLGGVYIIWELNNLNNKFKSRKDK